MFLVKTYGLILIIFVDNIENCVEHQNTSVTSARARAAATAHSAIDRYFFTIILFVLLWWKKNTNSTCNKYLFRSFFSHSIALFVLNSLPPLYHLSTASVHFISFFPLFCLSIAPSKMYPYHIFLWAILTFGISLWHLNIANIFRLLIFLVSFFFAWQFPRTIFSIKKSFPKKKYRKFAVRKRSMLRRRKKISEHH